MTMKALDALMLPGGRRRRTPKGWVESAESGLWFVRETERGR